MLVDLAWSGLEMAPSTKSEFVSKQCIGLLYPDDPSYQRAISLSMQDLQDYNHIFNQIKQARMKWESIPSLLPPI